MDRILLRHFKFFIGDSVDYVKIIEEVLGLKVTGLKRHFFFKKRFNEAYLLTKEVGELDPEKIEKIDTWIKVPKNIDFISFIARLEVETLLTSLDIGDSIDNIATIIAMVSYNETTGNRYDSDNPHFKHFKQRILNTQAIAILGIFNDVKSSIIESNKNWDRLFGEVNSVDQDFITAGGNLLDKFNVLISIKTLCREFNVTYDDAWHISYLTTQTSALANATQSLVQDRMAKIKEKRMDQKRKTGK